MNFEDKNLNYFGNCTDDDVIEHIFGDVNNFAQMIDEHGDEFILEDLVVKYDQDEDIHYFFYKIPQKEIVNEKTTGVLDEINQTKTPMYKPKI